MAVILDHDPHPAATSRYVCRVGDVPGGAVPDQFIYTHDHVLRVLDELLAGRGAAWWDEFFADRSRPCPFFVEWPDENLAAWFGEGLLAPGRVLELGCGHGRNATYLTGLGCSVDAVDFSGRCDQVGQEAGAASRRHGELRCCSIFNAEFTEASHDVIYDSGCFHHVPPHRRPDYAALVRRALKPGGSYGRCVLPARGRQRLHRPAGV